MFSAAIGGDWYVAVYDFEAAETTDLGLATGDYILVVEKWALLLISTDFIWRIVSNRNWKLKKAFSELETF